jgi:hypothetical protein
MPFAWSRAVALVRAIPPETEVIARHMNRGLGSLMGLLDWGLCEGRARPLESGEMGVSRPTPTEGLRVAYWA